MEMITKAYDLANKAHNGVCRRSGEPYICHPLAVARLVLDLGMDSESIAAALLHDVVEDTPTTLAAAMLQHRYDVQAALYTLALHRLLRQRLGAAYRPEDHLGGALYLFMRGLDGTWMQHLPIPSSLLDALEALITAPAEACA